MGSSPPGIHARIQDFSTLWPGHSPCSAVQAAMAACMDPLDEERQVGAGSSASCRSCFGSVSAKSQVTQSHGLPSLQGRLGKGPRKPEI